MNFIIPLDKMEEALNKGLYGVLKEAILIGDDTLSKGGKVIIEKQTGTIPEVVQVFEKKEDMIKWFESFAGFNK
ncbi:MAG: hypothetical protein ABRQ39_09205 [Candidatus Eremiobacterota bacterium]